VSGWEAGIRTPIRRSRVCSLTVRRPPNGALYFIKRCEIVSTTTHRSKLKLAMSKLCKTSLWLVLAVFSAGAVDWKALKPEGCVSDFARVIDGGSRQQLEAFCKDVERATGAELVVVTIPSLEGEPGEDVSRTLFEAWGAGRENSRILLMLAIRERRSRLEISPALDAILPDDLESGVLVEMSPAVRRQHYGEAAMAAASAIANAVARARHVSFNARLRREIRPSVWDSIPLAMLAGALLLLLWLMRAGGTWGYSGAGGSGFLPGMLLGGLWSRASWGSRGSGGFGGYDSGDSFGGFGGCGPKGRSHGSHLSCDW
jgi:uncharacterized protein